MCIVQQDGYELNWHPGPEALWTYTIRKTGTVLKMEAPHWELDGVLVAGLAGEWQLQQTTHLLHQVVEHRYAAPLLKAPDTRLEITFRIAPDNPVVRYRYTLSGKGRLTCTAGRNRLQYGGLTFPAASRAKEIRFSEFLEPVHSFNLSELPVSARDFAAGRTLMGPMLSASDDRQSVLAAYEHGSQVPDAFIQFRLRQGPGQEQGFHLEAVKGNYLDGHDLSEQLYETIWLQVAGVAGDEQLLAAQYRTFVLRYMCLYGESRKPYIFYNTWNYQERNYNWNGQPYLASMNLARILEEIEQAHRMGIEVFVIDTGWYEKTGDWEVHLARFPDELKQVKARLDQYGMKLGLWFGPTSAARSSRMLKAHRDCVMTWEGQEKAPHPIWETEESYDMCLVSRYADAFADKLIELSRTLGVTYFKWDAIGQYGCSCEHHRHGTTAHTEQERADYYAFRIGLEMNRIVEKLCIACPEAIVDFDVTEGSRFVGLGFLSVGKYFLINNGPYYVNYDLPNPPQYQMNSEERNWNLLFYPGPARTWICRTPLSYDKWLPSVLFLVHYFPDDGADDQRINTGSLVLGHNGIWGDLPGVSDEGVARIHALLEGYKAVRDDITAAPQRKLGQVGGNPEIYEKINPANGRGVVVLFASSFGKPFSTKLEGRYTYITQQPVSARYRQDGEGIHVSFDEAGHAIIEVQFSEPSARIVYFE